MTDAYAEALQAIANAADLRHLSESSDGLTDIEQSLKLALGAATSSFQSETHALSATRKLLVASGWLTVAVIAAAVIAWIAGAQTQAQIAAVFSAVVSAASAVIIRPAARIRTSMSQATLEIARMQSALALVAFIRRERDPVRRQGLEQQLLSDLAARPSR